MIPLKTSHKKVVRGPSLGSHIGGQNPLKIDPKGMKNQVRLLHRFLSICGSVLAPFGSHLELILVTFGVQKVARSEKVEFSKMLIFH